MSHVARRLRLHLLAAHRRNPPVQHISSSAVFCSDKSIPVKDVSRDHRKRVEELEQVGLSHCYPRLPASFSQQHSRDALRLAADKVGAGETLQDGAWKEPVCIAGRINGVRTAGSKLAFIDVVLSDRFPQSVDEKQVHSIQVVYQLSHVGVPTDEFKRVIKLMRPGDSYLFTGRPSRTPRGEYSLQVIAIPKLLSPSLHQIPEALDDVETRARKRHVDMLVNPAVVKALRVRAQIERAFNDFFESRDFVKVTTPILSAGAGGAVARPFKTEATELQGQQLHLRIAPELWLKRLVVGGLERVYEIGPSFRNEGVDATHNPEFTTCEFYQAYATLDNLIEETCSLLRVLTERFPIPTLSAVDISSDARIDFLPALERLLDCKLPDLTDADAQPQVLQILRANNVPTPASPSLPRLLDALSSHYLEPLCEKPTFIVNHPACLSPLSKHFRCQVTGQIVAARAELFIDSREYANMYEEENSPYEQRRKFEEQLKFRGIDGEGDGKTEVDDSYIEALEWGMPPTGGWGCGMDRLVMLFSERERISDVLSFGSLRNVVGLSRGRH